MPSYSTAQSRLGALFEEIVEKPAIEVSTDDLTENQVSESELQKYGIDRSESNFELLDDADLNSDKTPPFLFQPLCLQKLEEHKIDTSQLDEEEWRIWWYSATMIHLQMPWAAAMVLGVLIHALGECACMSAAGQPPFRETASCGCLGRIPWLLCRDLHM